MKRRALIAALAAMSASAFGAPNAFAQQDGGRSWGGGSDNERGRRGGEDGERGRRGAEHDARDVWRNDNDDNGGRSGRGRAIPDVEQPPPPPQPQPDWTARPQNSWRGAPAQGGGEPRRGEDNDRRWPQEGERNRGPSGDDWRRGDERHREWNGEPNRPPRGDTPRSPEWRGPRPDERRSDDWGRNDRSEGRGRNDEWRRDDNRRHVENHSRDRYRSGEWGRDWNGHNRGADWRRWDWNRDHHNYRPYRHLHRDFDRPRYSDWRHVRRGYYFDNGYRSIVRAFFGWDYYWWSYPNWRRPYRPWRVGYYLPDHVWWEPVPYDLYWRLPPAPYGCRYIMVERDILLISVDDGLILDALLFYDPYDRGYY